MLRRHMATTKHLKRRGFTLIECVVSIAIFAIMGTMFASFMISSVRVVNLTLANDRDREALLEAIASADAVLPGETIECPTENGTVTVRTIDTNNKILELKIDVYKDAITLDDNYVRYTAPNGTVYSIYLGTNAIAVKYLSIQNEEDNQHLLDAITGETDVDLQVTYKNETEKFTFKVECSKISDAKTPSMVEIIYGLDETGTKVPHYIKYRSPKGEKYLIYFNRTASVTP